MFKIIRFFFLVLPLLQSGIAFCSPENIQVNTSDSSKVHTAPQPLSSQWEGRFVDIFKCIEAGHWAQSAEEITQLIEDGKLAGYSGFPEMSQALLGRANQYLQDGHLEEASFLARKAVELSPHESGVLWNSASLFRKISGGGLFSSSTFGPIVFDALYHSLSSPVIALRVALALAVVVFTALTCALLIACVVQILARCDDLSKALAKPLSRAHQAYCGPFLMMIVLVLPLLGGIFSAILVWSLALALCARGSARLPLLAGGLAVLWALVIPVAAVCFRGVSLPLSNELQLISRGERVARAPQNIAGLLQFAPKDPLLLFLFGIVEAQSQNWTVAEEIFKKLADNEGIGTDLGKRARANQGTMMYAKGDLEGAFTALSAADKAGVKSFEALLMLSRVAAARVDTQETLNLNARLVAFDNKRTELFSKAAEKKIVLLSLPPQWLMLSTITRIALADSQIRKVSPNVRENDVGRYLSDLPEGLLWRGAHPIWLFIGGLVAMFAGWRLDVLHRRRNTFRNNTTSAERISFVWSLLPAGRILASSYPMVGLGLLGLVLSCVLVGTGVPVKLIPGNELESHIAGPAFFVAMIVWAYSLDIRQLIATIFKRGR